jgi:hypothetical protein
MCGIFGIISPVTINKKKERTDTVKVTLLIFIIKNKYGSVFNKKSN